MKDHHIPVYTFIWDLDVVFKVLRSYMKTVNVRNI